MAGMVEKVARAITLEVSDGKTDEGWPMYEDYARAAIAAMREPSAEMYDAYWSSTGDSIKARGYWQSMIDAALNEEQP